MKRVYTLNPNLNFIVRGNSYLINNPVEEDVFIANEITYDVIKLIRENEKVDLDRITNHIVSLYEIKKEDCLKDITSLIGALTDMNIVFIEE